MAILSSKQILQENNTSDHNSIRSLTLTHKALSDVSCLGEFKNLERLDLGFNNLTSLDGLKSCENLKWLSVVQNKLQSLKGIEGLTKLTVLNAGKNKIKSMDEVRSLVSLRALILNDNEITSFCKLDQMELNTIVLSRNPIHELGDALFKIKTITKLSLSHCQLQMIGSSLTSCTELKELRLAHNDIKTLPVELSHNARLQNLDIGNNLITNWSDLKVLSSLVHLKNLNLQGNPIAEKETLVKKVKKLLPNLQIVNAKPIDITMKKEGDRVRGSSVNDGSSLVDKMEKNIDPAMGNKKKNKYLLASEDEDGDPVYNALDIDMKKEAKLNKRKRNNLPDEQTSNLKEKIDGEKKEKKSKPKRDGDSIAGISEDGLVNPDTEDKLMKKKREKGKTSDHEGNSTITGKSSRKLNRQMKQNKASVIDDGEAPFAELLAIDTAETAINSVQEKYRSAVPDGDAGGGIVTVTMKKKKKSQGSHPASLELSPVAEVGLGGPSTWDD